MSINSQNIGQIPFDPRYADETTYTVEEDWAKTEDHEIEVIVVYLQEWCNGEMSEEPISEEKAFVYWTKGEVNHKEYKKYYEWLEKEAKKQAIVHL